MMCEWGYQGERGRRARPGKAERRISASARLDTGPPGIRLGARRPTSVPVGVFHAKRPAPLGVTRHLRVQAVILRTTVENLGDGPSTYRDCHRLC
ncbi:Hypothetical protein NTJ_01604 [Nesidiocoris tenuis]|uniref:Uncharacterized protein n=1 Tax=Nesidiocoris tenuis TaxID=355587 RepID=A0ABN7A905_9HEMI|nr:Hypothetical protein NTJ_01604 [Nesidiocoris tenuis]